MDPVALGGGSIAILKALRRGAGRPIASWSVGEGFFAWWGRSLAAWIPLRWRRTLGLDRGRVLLHVQGGELALRLQNGEGLRDVARIPLPGAGTAVIGAALPPEFVDLPRWFLLPAASGLRRRLLLPAAARDRLREVVGFEIDRQTPFAAGAVVYDTRIVGRRGAEGQIEAELVAVPLASLAEHMQALGDAADALAGIDLADADGGPIGVNLLAPTARRQRHGGVRGLNLALVAMALFAAALTMAQLLDNRRDALATLQAQADTRVAAARQVTLQRRELADLVTGRDYIGQLRQGRPAAVEVMDTLARELPDHTTLEKLAIENDRVQLVGLSGGASSLIGRLTGAGPLRSPALTGVLQPDPASGRERFTLTAKLADNASTTSEPDADGGPDARRP